MTKKSAFIEDPTHTNKKNQKTLTKPIFSKGKPKHHQNITQHIKPYGRRQHIPHAKALTTSLPTFNGKCEKFKLFEDLFRNNLIMYPHLSEIQKTNYFHSLLRGEALQAFRKLDDTKKDSLEDIITTFKRRFGDYLSMAKARCEWDTLKLDPSTQKLQEFLNSLHKTAKEAFGVEAQQFIDKAIYVKMPDHVKKILNRAYLEDKPYNDIVLHLEREMRLNGLGDPDDVTLVPLNHIETTTTPTTKSEPKRGLCFYCNKYGHYKPNAESLRETNGRKRKDKMDNSTQTDHSNQNVTPVGNPTRQRIDGMAPMQPMTRAPNDTLLHPQKLTKPPTSLQPKKQKTQIAATTIRGQCRREGILNRRYPDTIQSRFKPNF